MHNSTTTATKSYRKVFVGLLVCEGYGIAVGLGPLLWKAVVQLVRAATSGTAVKRYVLTKVGHPSRVLWKGGTIVHVSQVNQSLAEKQHEKSVWSATEYLLLKKKSIIKRHTRRKKTENSVCYSTSLQNANGRKETRPLPLFDI